MSPRSRAVRCDTADQGPIQERRLSPRSSDGAESRRAEGADGWVRADAGRRLPSRTAIRRPTRSRRLRVMGRPKSSDPSFEQVLYAAQAGSGWAFTRLYESLAPAVAGYLRAQGAEDPEDLTSEVFTRVFTDCGSFAGSEAQFRSWVFSVAHCRLIDARRARTRADSVLPLDAETLEHDHTPTSAAAEDEALRRLAMESTTQLLAQLTPDQRDVLALRLIGQMTVQEVAIVVGKPAGAVKALQRRALATLRRRMGVQARGPRTT